MSTAPPLFPPNEPLNPVLYRILAARFGPVKIDNAGVAMDDTVVPDPLRPGKQKWDIRVWGESYSIRCLFCDDTRQQFRINHRFGTIAPSGYPAYFLAKCFHRDCVRSRDRREELACRIFGLFRPDQAPADMPIGYPQQREHELVAVPVPGRIIRLAHVPPEHPACQFLREQGFDPMQIDHQYGVGYCEQAHPEFTPLTGRLVTPIFMHGKMVGWEGLRIGAQMTADWTVIPEFYNMPGLPRSDIVYNIEPASSYPFTVITASAMDCWRIGPPAVALLGRTISRWQSALIRTYFRQRPLFLMLDSQRPDMIDKAVERLEPVYHGAPVIKVECPGGYGPSRLDQHNVWAVICGAAQRYGIGPDFFAASGVPMHVLGDAVHLPTNLGPIVPRGYNT